MDNINNQMVVKCCCCEKIKTDLDWVHSDGSGNAAVRYSHTYCPTCMERTMLELDLSLSPAELKLAG